MTNNDELSQPELVPVNPSDGQEKQSNEPSKPPHFPVVGIGASAGGLNAFTQFFKSMAPQSGMAFVLIPHLAPHYKSELVEILQNHTSMEVTQVDEQSEIRPNHVYIIPPGKNLSVEKGILLLNEPGEHQGRQTSIDRFFRSLARDQGEEAVGIVLSGTGADGALGLKAIKEAGGLTMVQAPEEAEFDTMPRSAIETGIVDVVLPAAVLATKLVEIKTSASEIQIPPVEAMPAPEADILQDIFDLLRVKTGHDFIHYKRSTILRRLARRMQVRQMKNISSYRDYLRGHPDEADALFKDLLISVTNFFRDTETFEMLGQQIIPQLFAGKKQDDKVRVWVAGCATGEEAYSIAMLLMNYATEHSLSVPIQVFATDIDPDALQFAREGLYPETIVNDVAPELLKRFFIVERQGYRVAKDLRKLILFTAHDLLKDPPFSKLDLISCRNVLIYFNREVQERVFRMFHYALSEAGFLFLGSSESMESAKNVFSAVDQKSRVFRSQPIPNPTLWLTSLSPNVIAKESRRLREPTKKRTFSFNEVHQRLLAKQYGPPSVIVNENYEVVNVFGRAGRYLQFNEGEPTHNILNTTPPLISLELRTALYQAFQKETPTTFKRTRRIHVGVNGDQRLINLTVQRIQEEELAQGFAQVIFEEVENLEPLPLGSVSPTPDQDAAFLEAELRYTKEQLQTVIEQYETSNEELQASNEELLSMNEELQSTTEELETGREELQSMNEELEASKEELQSTNEELITVNEELQYKIEDLSRANNDLKNMIGSTDIALLFLDSNLSIKRYTPSITELFNIIPSDLGRPLSHVTGKLTYDQFSRDAEQVLHTLTKFRREVRIDDTKWYMMQITPYRTVEERVDGVVITFIEITELRQAQSKLETLNQQLEARVGERTEQVRALSSALTVAEQWERRRISQVLHDHLQQLLYGAQMSTQFLSGELLQNANPVQMEEIEQVNNLLGQAIRATRSLTVELNPPVLEGEGLEEALHWLAHYMQETYGLAVNLEIKRPISTVGQSMRMLLIQLTRELLFNVVKHANVDQVVVTIFEEKGRLHIEVKDEGQGFDPDVLKAQAQSGGHLGLFSVQERLALLGGRLDIVSHLGQGTCMTIVAPLLDGTEASQ